MSDTVGSKGGAKRGLNPDAPVFIPGAMRPPLRFSDAGGWVPSFAAPSATLPPNMTTIPAAPRKDTAEFRLDTHTQSPIHTQPVRTMHPHIPAMSSIRTQQPTMHTQQPTMHTQQPAMHTQQPTMHTQPPAMHTVVPHIVQPPIAPPPQVVGAPHLYMAAQGTPLVTGVVAAPRHQMEASKPAEPKPVEPRSIETKPQPPAEPKPVVESKHAAEPKAAEPKAAEPKAAEPKAAEPKAAEPKAAEPKAAEPKAAKPQPPAEAKPASESKPTAEPKPVEGVAMVVEAKVVEPKAPVEAKAQPAKTEESIPAPPLKTAQSWAARVKAVASLAPEPETPVKRRPATKPEPTQRETAAEGETRAASKKSRGERRVKKEKTRGDVSASPDVKTSEKASEKAAEKAAVPEKAGGSEPEEEKPKAVVGGARAWGPKGSVPSAVLAAPVKPVETVKPAEPKSTDSKSVETKKPRARKEKEEPKQRRGKNQESGARKTAESKPTETQPTEAKPVEVKPEAEVNPKPTETKPKPAETKPVEAKDKTEQSKTESVEAEDKPASEEKPRTEDPELKCTEDTKPTESDSHIDAEVKAEDVAKREAASKVEELVKAEESKTESEEKRSTIGLPRTSAWARPMPAAVFTEEAPAKSRLSSLMTPSSRLVYLDREMGSSQEASASASSKPSEKVLAPPSHTFEAKQGRQHICYDLEDLLKIRNDEICQQMPEKHDLPKWALKGMTSSASLNALESMGRGIRMSASESKFSVPASLMRKGFSSDFAAQEKTWSSGGLKPRSSAVKEEEQWSRASSSVKPMGTPMGNIPLPDVPEESWQKMQEKQKEEGARDVKIMRKLRAQLNKMAPTTYESILEAILEIGIENQDEAKDFVNLIFDKAISNHQYIDMYATLCADLKKNLETADGVFSKPDEQGGCDFRRILLMQCQETFEQTCNSPYVPPEDADEEEQFELILKHKHKMKGNLMFVGALVPLTPVRVLINIMTQLLVKKESMQLEALAAFLPNVLPIMEREKSTKIINEFEHLFERVKEVAGEPQTDHRIKCLLLDVIEEKDKRSEKNSHAKSPQGGYKRTNFSILLSK